MNASFGFAARHFIGTRRLRFDFVFSRWEFTNLITPLAKSAFVPVRLFS
jgi:hypothetical protein